MVFFLNEVTFGGLLNNLRIGASHQKDSVMTRNLELSTPSSYSLERRRGVGSGVNNNAYVIKPP